MCVKERATKSKEKSIVSVSRDVHDGREMNPASEINLLKLFIIFFFLFQHTFEWIFQTKMEGEA